MWSAGRPRVAPPDPVCPERVSRASSFVKGIGRVGLVAPFYGRERTGLRGPHLCGALDGEVGGYTPPPQGRWRRQNVNQGIAHLIAAPGKHANQGRLD